MKCWFVLILLLEILSCSNSSKPIAKKYGNSLESLQNDTCVFIFKNDTICQTIRIVEYPDKQITYDYQVNNLKLKLSITKKGSAKEKETENMELGEDEDGNSYPVDVYETKDGSCWISISIDKDRKDKLTIITTPECSTKRQLQQTPFSSIGIMRKVH